MIYSFPDVSRNPMDQTQCFNAFVQFAKLDEMSHDNMLLQSHNLSLDCLR